MRRSPARAFTALFAAAALTAAGLSVAHASSDAPSESITMEDSTGATWQIASFSPPTRAQGGDAVIVPDSAGSGDLDALVGAVLDPELPDEVAAAFAPGEPGPQTRVVIGNDDRTRITNVTASPYVQMPYFIFTAADGSTSGCTGWLYGNRTLATAAHCLSDGAGNWYSNYRVYFGLNESTAYAQCGNSVLAAPTGWDGKAGSDYDWGVIVLNCNAGTVLGTMGFKAPEGIPVGNWSITGYPADKLPERTMWTHAGPVTHKTSNTWMYSIDSYHGQSGAPIWRLEAGSACGNCVIGIHTTGGSMNSGVRITSTVGGALKAYSERYP